VKEIKYGVGEVRGNISYDSIFFTNASDGSSLGVD